MGSMISFDVPPTRNVIFILHPDLIRIGEFTVAIRTSVKTINKYECTAILIQRNLQLKWPVGPDTN